MKKSLLCGVAFIALVGLVASVNPASAQLGGFGGFGGGAPIGGGHGGGGGPAIGIIAVATWFAVLNPRKGSDSILANSIHDEWKCRLDGKDRRTRCAEFNKLPRRERVRLYNEAGIPVS